MDSQENTIKIDTSVKGDQLHIYTQCLMELIEAKIWTEDKYQTQPSKFYHEIVMKSLSLLDSTSLLIKNMDNKPHFIHTLYLTLRTSLLDIICVYWIMDAHDNTTLCIERIDRIMADHIRVFYNSAKTEDEKKEIRTTWPQFFDGEELIHKKGIASIYMVNTMCNYPYMKYEAKEAQLFYEIFSKFEHNGHFTSSLIFNIHEDKEFEKNKSMIIKATIVVLIGINTVLQNWMDKDDAHYRRIEYYCDKFHNEHS